VKEEEAGSGNSSKDSERCCLWVWKRLPNLFTAWMGPLEREMYSCLTQSVFRLDSVKYSLLYVERTIAIHYLF
jgi:hypothetical protein